MFLAYADDKSLSATATPGEDGTIVLSGAVPDVPRRDANIRYDLDLSKERYFLFVPSGYTGKEAYGLVVYTSPWDKMTELPSGWKAILERRKLLFLAAQSAGNNRDPAGEPDVPRALI